MLNFEQGALDSLCGIYSLINAERIINLSTDDQSQKLFNSIIDYLDKERLLADVLTQGMSLKNIKLVLNNVIKHRIPNTQIRFSGVKNPDLDTFWQEIINFLAEDSSDVSGKRRAVLLGMSGVHDHWTVIKSITEKQIKLFDSDGLKYLNRIRCTTYNESQNRKHVLYPAQTYFLSGE